MPGPVRWGLIASLALSAAALALYALGSMPEPGFSDRTLFTLLRVLRYVALFVIVFSLCALVFGVRLMVRRPRIRYALCIGLYALCGIFGLALVILTAFIVVAAGGNG
jgi:hypothetical protein